MLKQSSLFLSIFILILVVIISFENLFFSQGSFYILFWEMKGSATWLIMGIFLLGVVFGMSLFMFFHSDPDSYGDGESPADNNSQWQ